VSGHSTTLLFTSPYLPIWKSGALADGGLPTPGSGLLPSPTPEPATLALVGLGLGGLLARRRRWPCWAWAPWRRWFAVAAVGELKGGPARRALRGLKRRGGEALPVLRG